MNMILVDNKLNVFFIIIKYIYNLHLHLQACFSQNMPVYILDIISLDAT